ncbi:MAG: MBL fold metallo-hydrolase [Rickettsiales bacterium]|nr:MBL fold metallo-hydrolase [Rickettsiales bacterium]
MKNPDVKSFFDSVTSTWSYVVWCESSENRNCAVIDSVLDFDINSGKVSTTSADLIVNFIREKNLNLEWILETHIHADHLTAANYLKEKLGGKTGVTNRIVAVLKTWEKILNNAADTPLTGEQFDHLFADNEEFKIGELSAQIIATPGHTPADTSFLIGETIFAGDAIFLPDIGSGRCDFPDGSAEDSFDSVQKLLAFPDFYKLYIGHDYPPAGVREAECVTTVGEEKAKNIRLKSEISKQEFVEKRRKDDTDKPVPKLLFPSLQVNLRAGRFGAAQNGTNYIKIPVTF